MGDSILTLIIEKGPKKGESVECRPGRRVLIGRVVRGNTLGIKDSGISEKHISVESLDDLWSLTDLDTSNGTFLNGRSLEPLVPSLLKDGDLIEIGIRTAIAVSISRVPEATVDGGRRRGRSRKGGEVASMESLGEVVRESKKEIEQVGRTRGATRRAAAAAVAAEIGKGDAANPIEVVKKDVEVVGKGRGASRSVRFDLRSVDGEVKSKGLEDQSGECELGREVSVSGGCCNGRDEVVVDEQEVDDGVERIDMETMTMGQWLDRLERCFPLMINDAAEEIIEEIREKADKFNEFLSRASDAA